MMTDPNPITGPSLSRRNGGGWRLSYRGYFPHGQFVRNFRTLVEELLRGVNSIHLSEIEWKAALNNVDNPAISPSQRAVCFHILIEQGTKDALNGYAGDWQVLSGDDHKAREAMNWTAHERIAKVISRIRQGFPDLASEYLG